MAEFLQPALFDRLERPDFDWPARVLFRSATRSGETRFGVVI